MFFEFCFGDGFNLGWVRVVEYVVGIVRVRVWVVL